MAPGLLPDSGEWFGRPGHPAQPGGQTYSVVAGPVQMSDRFMPTGEMAEDAISTYCQFTLRQSG